MKQLRTVLPDGKWVSTVLLNPIAHMLDLGYLITTFHPDSTRPGQKVNNGKPYETMVFPARGNWTEIDAARYDTEEEARAGHQVMVEKWSKQGGES